MDKDSYVENLKDRLLTVSFAEWSALLSVNGLILAAGSITATMKPQCPVWIVASLFASNIVSALLLVLNMRFYRNSYQTAYEQTQKEKPDDDYRRAVLSGDFFRRRKHYHRLEFFGDTLLVLGIVFLFHMLITY